MPRPCSPGLDAGVAPVGARHDLPGHHPAPCAEAVRLPGRWHGLLPAAARRARCPRLGRRRPRPAAPGGAAARRPPRQRWRPWRRCAAPASAALAAAAPARSGAGCIRRAVRPATAPASMLPGPSGCGTSDCGPLLLPAATRDQLQEANTGSECPAAQGLDAGAAAPTPRAGRRASAPVQAALLVAPVQAAEACGAAPGPGASRRRRSGKTDRLLLAGVPPAAGSHKPQIDPEAAAAIQAAAADARWRALAVGLLLTPRAGLLPLGPCSTVLTRLPPWTATGTEPESLLLEDRGARALLPRPSTGPGRPQHLEGAWSAGPASADEKAQGPCMRAADALPPCHAQHCPPCCFVSGMCFGDSQRGMRAARGYAPSIGRSAGTRNRKRRQAAGLEPRPALLRAPARGCRGAPSGRPWSPDAGCQPARRDEPRARALALLLALRPARAVQPRSLSTSQELQHARAPRARA